MRVGCLQFSPKVGDIEANVEKANKMIEDIVEGDLDLLVLPELALTGYNFLSLREIKPFLSVAGSGPSCSWAQKTAQRLKCFVSIGYPEKAHAPAAPGVTPKKLIPSGLDKRYNYNSNIIYGPSGEIAGHYRKCFLFPTDLTWASEPLDYLKQPEGFFAADIGVPLSRKLALAICMDINPYKFDVMSGKVEFASHVLQENADIAVVSMAWSSVATTVDDLEGESRNKPDVKTLGYWVERFKPVIDSTKTVLLVIGNRCGIEDDVCYTGSSLVARLGQGKVELWDVLGQGQEKLLIVDTAGKPKFLWEQGLREFTES